MESSTKIPLLIMQRKDLSLKAKGLLLCILSEENPTLNSIKSIAREGMDSILSGLKELESFGYIWIGDKKSIWVNRNMLDFDTEVDK